VATFDPDGNNWFTPGIIRPRRSMINGIEDFYRAVLDILTMHLHPHQIINNEFVLNSKAATDMQPYGKTVIRGPGKAGDVVSFVTPPSIPQFVLEIGSRLEEKNESSAGQPKSLQGQGTAGLVRGGSGAMESLRQSTSGREKMTANHQEKGWYTSVAEQTLILCQMLSNDKEMMQKLQYNPTTGKSDLAWEEITRDDIRQVYRVQLSFTEKSSNQLVEITRTSMIYDRLLQNENVNRKELAAFLIGNTKTYNQLTSGVNPADNIQMMQSVAGKKQPTESVSSEMPLVGGAGISAGGLSE
jgi:hypothetical protein